MREILKWFGDYFLRSTFRNGNGDVVAFAYQVGEGSVDHQLWAPPELHNLARPAYFATSETPARDQSTGAAAALAPITNDPKHWYYARWNLEYWSSIAHEDPSDTNFLAATPSGFKVIASRGSARYNVAAQLEAFVYRKYTGRTDFADWTHVTLYRNGLLVWGTEP